MRRVVFADPLQFTFANCSVLSKNLDLIFTNIIMRLFPFISFKLYGKRKRFVCSYHCYCQIIIIIVRLSLIVIL